MFTSMDKEAGGRIGILALATQGAIAAGAGSRGGLEETVRMDAACQRAEQAGGIKSSDNELMQWHGAVLNCRWLVEGMQAARERGSRAGQPGYS